MRLLAWAVHPSIVLRHETSRFVGTTFSNSLAYGIVGVLPYFLVADEFLDRIVLVAASPSPRPACSQREGDSPGTAGWPHRAPEPPETRIHLTLSCQPWVGPTIKDNILTRQVACVSAAN